MSKRKREGHEGHGGHGDDYIGDILVKLKLLFESNTGDVKIQICNADGEIQYITVMSEILKTHSNILDFISDDVIDMTEFNDVIVMKFLRYIYYRDVDDIDDLTKLNDTLKLLDIATPYNCQQLTADITTTISKLVDENSLQQILTECAKFPDITADIRSVCTKLVTDRCKNIRCEDQRSQEYYRYCCLHKYKVGKTPYYCRSGHFMKRSCVHYTVENIPLPDKLDDVLTNECCLHGHKSRSMDKILDKQKLLELPDSTKIELFNELAKTDLF
ncbi:MAG: hypothetical protein Faunusvirus1_19 [Faunusvirus sp.]|jgi:hypothetical protein|uniref:BTB domain-containing protein n=1 Tax=Faunusvirus sp. TaxID=2487766 RepID=A0A3G5A0A0_9VIRU|nr:MAG: hypothetical protein Faunusvirus1_19 [Faunusvirus sp.]